MIVKIGINFFEIRESEEMPKFELHVQCSYHSIQNFTTYQISPMYVMIGDSIRPTPRPSNEFAMKISVTVVALYNIYHAIINGIFTSNIEVFRPNGSIN